MADPFYKETFGGSGLLAGKAADVGFAGFTYANLVGGLIVQDSGFGVMFASSGTAGLGVVTEPPPATPATDVTQFDCTFKWLTPPDLGAISGAQLMLQFVSKRPSDSTRIDFHEAIIEVNSGVTYLHPSTRSATSLLTVVPGVVANTVYDLTFRVSEAGVSLEMLGVTATAFADSDRLCGPVCGVLLTIKSGNGLGDIEAAQASSAAEPKWTLFRNTYELP